MASRSVVPMALNSGWTAYARTNIYTTQLRLGTHDYRHTASSTAVHSRTYRACQRDVDKIWRRRLIGSRSASTSSVAGHARTVYLALGSNEGDRLSNIEMACDLVAAHPAIHLIRTSSLYESTPMYYTKQDNFFNAACEIKTILSPVQLLDELQAIERQMGRVKTIDKGPRKIDLDILLFEHESIDTERLIIPHRLMHEREFVLRPLADIAPDARIRSVHATKSIAMHLQDLPEYDPTLTALVPIGQDRFLRPLDPSRRTHLMAILNITPDSFSDGGKHFSEAQSISDDVVDSPQGQNNNVAISQVVAEGADILDFGGQSSRPGAASVGAEVEASRVLPVLKLAHRSTQQALSLDTYRSQVVGRVSETSATSPHIVNDISGGLLDPEMLSMVAKHKQTIVLSHLRGTPETMQSATNLEYPTGVVEEVASELLDRVRAAEEAGIRRWRIILDPGIGFAKQRAQNMALLRDLPRLRAWRGLQGMPWLIGTSRKRFIGELLRPSAGGKGIRDVKEREWGTAATVAAAIAGGADIVRVHNVAAMRDVVDVSDAIYRQR